MEVVISPQTKRFLIGPAFFSLALLLGTLLLPRVAGQTVVQVLGFDSGQRAAVAGARAFYTVDYQNGPDLWAAWLCALSTEAADGCTSSSWHLTCAGSHFPFV